MISMSRGVPLGCVAPSAFSPVIQSEAKNLGFLGKHLPFLLNTSRICGLKQLRGEVISIIPDDEDGAEWLRSFGRSRSLRMTATFPVIQSAAKNLRFLGKHHHRSINNSRICGLKKLRGEVISIIPDDEDGAEWLRSFGRSRSLRMTKKKRALPLDDK